MITDVNNPAGSAMAQSSIAVMWDVIADGEFANAGGGDGIISFNHVPGGGNVLFMDGHTEFVKYPQGASDGVTMGRFPITPMVARCNGRTIGPGKAFEFDVNP
jgi:prepilin-type processing-associated H-X9-DG protein